MNRIVVLLCCLVFVSVLAAQEDPPRGRLDDGRAYRTDNEGVQLVDYIAELELSIDELNRKANGLSYEVEQKDLEIQALRRNGGTVPAIAERDILSEGVASKKNIRSNSANCPQTVCPEVEAIDCQMECREQVAAATARAKSYNQGERNSEAVALKQLLKERDAQITAKNIEIERIKSDNKQQNLAARKVSDNNDTVRILEKLSDAETEAAKVSAKYQEGQSELTLVSQKLQHEVATREKLVSEVDAVTSERDQLTKQLKKLTQEKEETLASLKQENIQLAAKLTAANQQKSLAVNVNTAGTSTTYEIASSSVNSQKRASFSPQQMRKIQTMQSELQTIYNRLRGHIAERDRRYAIYMKDHGKDSVLVTMSALKSSNGMNITQVRGAIANLSSIQEAGELRRDLMEIKNKVKEDIDLINRMDKFRR